MASLTTSYSDYSFSFKLFISFVVYGYCVSLIIINPASSAPTPPPPSSILLTSVCRNTTDYNFCFDSLSSSDPRAATATADPIELAYASFRLAYSKATATKAYIDDHLLKSSSSSEAASNPLHRCSGFYEEAMEALEAAYGDLDSESYYWLAELAGVAGKKVADCNKSFIRRKVPTPLSRMIRDLKNLCQICLVISNLFITS
ncbi:uncharacterized protein LOC124916391 [Impatiens glandulifera]|uniref:uncharacterized protein LOC124916391 n=1 Tax=Impatiens glandulifera TaxID=253017 RepID=UPI001FB0BCA9|nr:uncharacterized protein LOC124916391 [Impatiens glandulifera]